MVAKVRQPRLSTSCIANSPFIIQKTSGNLKIVGVLEALNELWIRLFENVENLAAIVLDDRPLDFVLDVNEIDESLKKDLQRLKLKSFIMNSSTLARLVDEHGIEAEKNPRKLKDLWDRVLEQYKALTGEFFNYYAW